MGHVFFMLDKHLKFGSMCNNIRANQKTSEDKRISANLEQLSKCPKTKKILTQAREQFFRETMEGAVDGSCGLVDR